MQYTILDPTGNITALVEDQIDPAKQPQVALDLMSRHPEVEQVGFVFFAPHDDVPVHLRMAGGEFCGNATICAAALYCSKEERSPHDVRVAVSGIGHPIQVQVTAESRKAYKACISMPLPRGISHTEFLLAGKRVTLPVVCMEGIQHVIVCDNEPVCELLRDSTAAESAARDWCSELNAEGLGIMFVSNEGATLHLTPLVYVPGSNTMFWENSCASGSAATAAYLSWNQHSPVDITLHEPGGDLRVQCDWASQAILLHGKAVIR